MVEKKKSVSIEIIRTLACIAVFNQHILGAMARRNNGALPINVEKFIVIAFELSRFAVPTFVFMFAYFMAKSKYRGYLDFLKKKSVQIYVPYIFISLVGMWYTYTVNHEWIGLQAVVSNIILGNSFYHLWYIPMIFQFVLIAPIVFLLVKFLQNKKHVPLFYVFFSTICFLYMFIMPTLSLPPIVSNNYTRLFTTWSFFFVTGLICGIYSEEFRACYNKILPLAIVVSVVAIGFAINQDFSYISENSVVSFSQVNFLKPAYAVFTVFEIFALFGIAERFEKISCISKISLYVGKHSFMIYLVHGICISYVSLKMIENFPSMSLELFYLILYPLSFGLSVVCALVIDKFKKY